MPLKFRKATAVAVGTFNIYIIQPKWLAEVGLLAKGLQVRLDADLNRPGFRFKAEEAATTWEVRPERLIVETANHTEDCGGLLANVLDKLPWTPLLAVGTNLEFAGDAAVLANLPKRCRLPDCQQPQGHEIGQRTIHAGTNRGDQIFNVQLSVTAEAELSLNVHTELKNKGSQQDINRLAQDACRDFFRFRDEAIDLAKHLFGVEIEL